MSPPLFISQHYEIKKHLQEQVLSIGAEDEIRTRDVHLGKVTLYH